ncbi:DNA/RNA endonuclease G [Microbacterium sp. CFBP 8790]|uniref:DNA/RNA endonuclease G n=1 Tax=unclassified Microbacterium TaxID=2609290 RepID=UPI00177DAFFD|nr:MULTISPECIES: DNA/RNA endonuclease G [unclassified Microbacterium]MBD8207602.1 DNA/RNA endonuclease G [Microbacterium sp. CFBP 8801]MBD8217308.1 DNA/RNA endonuclease G [Microbacterium sp. CFBP 13617]MBD8508985.1 DNA/RNA endonuclease G [Microbacterium sp. CFBP 8790]
MTDAVLRTVVRRETHSPRTVAMIVVAVLLLLVLAYAAVEIILNLVGQPALLVAPGEALNAVVAAPTALLPVAFIVGGIVLALVGVLVLVLALKPGRLSRHEMAWGERAVVVDNGVVASAVAQHLSNESGIARDDIVVGVAHRSVDVTVRPPVGIPVDEAELRRLVEEEVTSYKLSPAVRTHLRVQRPDTKESR